VQISGKGFSSVLGYLLSESAHIGVILKAITLATLSKNLNKIQYIFLDLQLLQARTIDNDRAPFEVIF
jgi:hypothetical protein